MIKDKKPQEAQTKECSTKQNNTRENEKKKRYTIDSALQESLVPAVHCLFCQRLVNA